MKEWRKAHNRQWLASTTPTKDEGRRMEAENSQERISRELHSNRKIAMSDWCTNARISLENRHFSPLLGTLGAPSRWQSSLSMSLQQQEIGPEACPPRRPGNPVAGVPENCNIEFRSCKPDTDSFRVGDQVECTMD